MKNNHKNTVMSEQNVDLETEDNSTVIGIDLGTRFSCVSVWKDKKFEIIPDQFGNRTIPSVVAFYRSAKLVGHNALAMKSVNPANTIYDIKRIIGRRLDDPIVEQTRKILSYDIIDDQSKYNNILVQLDKNDVSVTHKKIFHPEEICSLILLEIKKMASTYLHKPISKAVITVPAYFNDAQRQATLDAAKIAGLEVLKIINEPTAAALAYGLGDRRWTNNGGGNIIVYDMGAGTLDVSLMNINNGAFRTLAVGGNSHLGGEDIDYLVMNHVLIEFQKRHKIRDLQISKLSQLKLKNSVETAKKILSSTDKAVICVDNFCNNLQLYYVITRELFEAINNELFIMCIKPISDVLDSAGLSKKDIDEVILVGGSTRIPKIQTMILKFFKHTAIKNLVSSLNPDEVVSVGASIYGYIMTHGNDPFSQNLVLLDITPLSLGVETLQNQMTVIIPRNTVIPTKKTKIFSNDTDYQDTVSIKIFEGERKLTKNNFHVGTFELSGFEKGPRGYSTIKITFQIDINGILQVTAHEKKSGACNSIKITSTWGAKGRLSKFDIDNIIAESEKHEQIDTLYSVKIGLVYKINSIINAILVNLKDDAFALTNADKKKIRMDIRHVTKWLQNKDPIDLPTDELERCDKRLSKTYSPLIAQANKSNDNFADKAVNSNVAEIHGDDDDNEGLQQYEKIQLPNDPSEFDKEEIKTLKKTITDLGKNILSVINNPVSNFKEEDIETMTDYITSVNIWLYTTNAATTIEFVSKIDEINKFTEEIMKKYEDHSFFTKKETFTVRDELNLTCLTLNSSLKSNFFSLKQDETDKLKKLINNTKIWLLTHQNEEPDVYTQKIDEISDLCNQIYHNMNKLKVLENIDLVGNNTDSDSDDEPDSRQKNQSGYKISEDIDSILNNMPNQSNKSSKSNDVLLKIDMNKLNKKTSFKYKNVNC